MAEARLTEKLVAVALTVAEMLLIAPPAPSAGLPASKAIVCVAPPLLANGPSRGLIGLPEAPIWLPLVPDVRPVKPSPSPMRLCALDDCAAPKISGSPELVS